MYHLFIPSWNICYSSVHSEGCRALEMCSVYVTIWYCQHCPKVPCLPSTSGQGSAPLPVILSPKDLRTFFFLIAVKGLSYLEHRFWNYWSDGLKLINGGHNHFWLLYFSWLLYCFDLQYELAQQLKEAWQVWYSHYIKQFRGRCQKAIASVNKIYTTWTRKQFIFFFEDVWSLLVCYKSR